MNADSLGGVWPAMIHPASSAVFYIEAIGGGLRHLPVQRDVRTDRDKTAVERETPQVDCESPLSLPLSLQAAAAIQTGPRPLARWPSARSLHFKVEDPFEVPDNAARTVSDGGLTVISRAFADTFTKLSSAEVLSDKNALLSILLSPRALRHAGVPRRSPQDDAPAQARGNRAAEATRGARRAPTWLLPSSRQSAAPGGAQRGGWLRRGTSC